MPIGVGQWTCRRALVVGALVAVPSTARAGDDLQNWMIGPVLGVQLSGNPESRAIFGFEGGAGYGPERINLGLELRDNKSFGYIELDPWYIVGGSIGLGLDSDDQAHPVIGIWEGLPLNDTGGCSGWHRQFSIAGGYRYTGVHELYVTIKGGVQDGNVCFD